jgi:hypothetical protein
MLGAMFGCHQSCLLEEAPRADGLCLASDLSSGDPDNGSIALPAIE